jgi:hypothetical protein
MRLGALSLTLLVTGCSSYSQYQAAQAATAVALVAATAVAAGAAQSAATPTEVHRARANAEPVETTECGPKRRFQLLCTRDERRECFYRTNFGREYACPEYLCVDGPPRSLQAWCDED